MRQLRVGAPVFTRVDASSRARRLRPHTASWFVLGVALPLSCDAFAPNDPPTSSLPPVPPGMGVQGPTRSPPASGGESIGRAGTGGAGRAGNGGRGGLATDATDAGEDAAVDAALDADAAGGSDAAL